MREQVDLRTCEKGDLLLSALGATLIYLEPCAPEDYMDHKVQYIEMPDGSKPKDCFGSRTHDGYVFRKKRLPETDHDIVEIIKKK